MKCNPLDTHRRSKHNEPRLIQRFQIESTSVQDPASTLIVCVSDSFHWHCKFISAPPHTHRRSRHLEPRLIQNFSAKPTSAQKTPPLRCPSIGISRCEFTSATMKIFLGPMVIPDNGKKDIRRSVKSGIELRTSGLWCKS